MSVIYKAIYASAWTPIVITIAGFAIGWLYLKLYPDGNGPRIYHAAYLIGFFLALVFMTIMFINTVLVGIASWQFDWRIVTYLICTPTFYLTSGLCWMMILLGG